MGLQDPWPSRPSSAAQRRAWQLRRIAQPAPAADGLSGSWLSAGSGVDRRGAAGAGPCLRRGTAGGRRVAGDAPRARAHPRPCGDHRGGVGVRRRAPRSPCPPLGGGGAGARPRAAGRGGSAQGAGGSAADLRTVVWDSGAGLVPDRAVRGEWQELKERFRLAATPPPPCPHRARRAAIRCSRWPRIAAGRRDAVRADLDAPRCPELCGGPRGGHQLVSPTPAQDGDGRRCALSIRSTWSGWWAPVAASWERSSGPSGSRSWSTGRKERPTGWSGGRLRLHRWSSGWSGRPGSATAILKRERIRGEALSGRYETVVRPVSDADFEAIRRVAEAAECWRPRHTCRAELSVDPGRGHAATATAGSLEGARKRGALERGRRRPAARGRSSTWRWRWCAPGTASRGSRSADDGVTAVDVSKGEAEPPLAETPGRARRCPVTVAPRDSVLSSPPPCSPGLRRKSWTRGSTAASGNRCSVGCGSSSPPPTAATDPAAQAPDRGAAGPGTGDQQLLPPAGREAGRPGLRAGAGARGEGRRTPACSPMRC